ncbi:DUF3551 domain-containing protein [Bradyrhizobium sp. LTSPM299]|uniref:DUF3551 domain-containing protein n=1 Tax=Bradyrhizobium sp. LTSPM299 TaxID=1619233 RepID=UPI0009E399BD|nr:DUF3551 domain-containing protein [Bradyrhizobium sp. LTSPM299]
MRLSRLAVLALGAMMLTGVANIAPAWADPNDYPWCAQGPSWGYPGECMYQTFEQCEASVSGQYLACGENPRFLFREQSQFQSLPQPHRRRHRHVHRH